MEGVALLATLLGVVGLALGVFGVDSSTSNRNGCGLTLPRSLLPPPLGFFARLCAGCLCPCQTSTISSPTSSRTWGVTGSGMGARSLSTSA